jgi:hypothetical protein
MPAEYEKMTEFGLVWTATLDGPESVDTTTVYNIAARATA